MTDLKICSFPECGRKFMAKGYCASHYNQVRNGRPASKLQADTSASERFWSKVDKTEDCWIWTGAIQSGGYGTFAIPHGAVVKAHRFAYEDLTGVSLTPEDIVDHLCRNRKCVNPQHVRITDKQGNAENANLRSDNTSGFRGTSYHKATGKWSAYASLRGKVHHLGLFLTAEEAAARSKEFRNEHYSLKES